MADNKPSARTKKTRSKKRADVEMLTPAYTAADRDLQAADTIISMVMDAAREGQFNLHVTKLREQSPYGISEELVEKKLGALDTKRILEAARALEKAVLLRRKLLDMEEKKRPAANDAGPQMRIILPEVRPPELPPGAAQGGGD